ncbi:MAG: hypothetical protein BroJett003_24120 [Planctomycetota bacterium]|nr:MAG: hypothetical protein BroJett003_24120 [Planctomycetota bacterium]
MQGNNTRAASAARSCKEAFRVSKSRAKRLAERKRRMAWRLRVRQWSEQARPMFKARNIRYDPTDKARGLGEEVAEFEHAPQACRRSYRMIVVRKRIAVEKGQERLFTDYRYFFTITNDREHILPTIVPTAHGRCDQENLIDQLKHGVHVGAGGPRGAAGGVQTAVVEPVAERAAARGGGVVSPAADRGGPLLSAALLNSERDAGVRMPRFGSVFLKTQTRCACRKPQLAAA